MVGFGSKTSRKIITMCAVLELTWVEECIELVGAGARDCIMAATVNALFAALGPWALSAGVKVDLIACNKKYVHAEIVETLIALAEIEYVMRDWKL